MICTAVSSCGAFGLRGSLPWAIREELQHFREVTLGKRLLVGTNTVLPPLPGRTIFRASRESIPDDVVLIGGKTLIEALQHDPRWRVWKLTVILFPKEIEADTFFSPDLRDWVLTEEHRQQAWCRKNECEVTLCFRTYERNPSPLQHDSV